MYRAKEEGRNRVCFYEPQIQQAIEARLALERDLRAGLAQQGFELHLQPQCSGSGDVLGAEALLRWRHPQRGLLTPDAFIAQAETSGLIVPLGRWVIERAVELLARWQGLGLAWTLSVNVSPRQFQDAQFIEHLRQTLDRFRVPGARLILELTEGLLLEHTPEVMERLQTLKAMGVGLSLDDFGVGYSSLAYLKRLPIDEVKIDRSFVRDLPQDREDAVIARTIAAIAGQMRLDLIAEGVETEAQLEFLCGLGCQRFQGYYFGRPLPAAEFETRHRQPRHGRHGSPPPCPSPA